MNYATGLDSSFSPTWHTFKHSLYSLTPAERVIKTRKAYIARISPDGQVMVLAMNQKLAAHNRVMFYSLSQTAVAVIADLKGCGAKLNDNGHSPSGKLVFKLINNLSSLNKGFHGCGCVCMAKVN